MTLTLPRTLVMELLHRAQMEPSAEATILRLRDGTLVLHPAEGATPFACFRATASVTAPTPAEVERCRRTAPLLLLQAALGTRGVLQLKAWKLDGDSAQPLEMELAEEDAQGSGNSSVA